MLSNEQKRQLFIKLREENYRASLRLEGFKTNPAPPGPKTIAPTLAQLKEKYGR